jgi:hypothetical protein
VSASSQHPVIPAAEERQETAPATFVACEKFSGVSCFHWACCKRAVTYRAPREPVQAAVLDIEAMADLTAPLGSPDFFAQWHDASDRKETEYLDGERAAQRQEWEG